MTEEYDDTLLYSNQAYQYAKDVINGDIVAGKYVKIVCQNFLDDIDRVDDEDFPYFFDTELVELVQNLCKLLNMASGVESGGTVYDALGGFQWFFILSVLCWKHADNPDKRRYEQSVLLIARKSGKTFLIALLFVLLLLTEPENSEFYSVAPDKDLSSIIKKELEQMIEKSPAISKYFVIIKTEIRCTITKSKFVPLANSNNRLDGRKANVFVADEVGALRNRYPIDAMVSSQMNMLNRTGILISTAYESLDNPMTQEVEFCKRVLDGQAEEESLFALLYMPDDSLNWTDDDEMLKANPLCYDVPENLEYLHKQRNKAIEQPETKKNFLTKHMNIFVEGNDAELFVRNEDLVKGRMKNGEFDWNSKKVYVGVDLASTDDNTSIAMVHYDPYSTNFYTKVWAFIPKDSVDLKSKAEKHDYNLDIEKGTCFASGDRVISYMFVEQFLLDLEKDYGVTIAGIGYDRHNCISSANKWEEAGYDPIEVRQHSTAMGPATKLLKESILSQRFFYDENRLYEINFSNARESRDTNLTGYVNKKQSNGKVDMVVATIDAMVLWVDDIAGNDSVYENRGFIVL